MFQRLYVAGQWQGGDPPVLVVVDAGYDVTDWHEEQASRSPPNLPQPDDQLRMVFTSETASPKTAPVTS